LIIDRNVLGWRLDPACPHRIAEADSANRRMIIVCNEGYSSSVVAASLRQLGIERAPISLSDSTRGNDSQLKPSS
jgi:rhodanese-related sulfurtransferase